MKSIRLVSSLPFQGLSLRDVSCAPLLASSPFLASRLEYIFSSRLNPLTPIDVYRHLYKLAYALHLLKSIGEENDSNSGISEGVDRFGNTG